MTEAHLHLLVNHVPVIGMMFALAALLYAAVVRQAGARQLALAAVVAAGISAVPALLTGEPAEEQIEHLPGFDKRLIHEHEEAGELATWIAAATAIAGAAALVLPRIKRGTRAGERLYWVALAGAVVTSVAMARTAYLGGVIRHPEIRASAPNDAQAPHATE